MTTKLIRHALVFLAAFAWAQVAEAFTVQVMMGSEAQSPSLVFGEAEAPEHAPDPAMAERRLGFYARNGLQTAGYDTEVFGVHYKTLYLADHKVEDAALMAEHDFVYKNSFTPEKYAKYVRIPYDPAKVPGEQVAWDQ